MQLSNLINPVFRNASGSPIRELKRFSEQPGMISLAGGYPAPELMDAAGLRRSLEAQPDVDFSRALEYGATEGSAALREQLARVSNGRGLNTSASDILVLSGSQQGIDLLARTLIIPGDAVLVEGPSYPAALSAFRFAGARVHQLKTDAEGIVIEGLESALSSLKPKLLYTVPTFGNPSGSTLSLERRRKLLELVVQFGCLLVEDDPYGELWFESPAPAPIRAMRSEVPGAEQYCIYLSSLSKSLAPALRLGWMLAPAEIRRACVLAKQTDDMHASTFTQALAAAYLAEGSFDRHLPFLRARYGNRARALTAALRNRLGQQVEFVEPAGGMFVWVRIPGIDTSKLLPEAIQRNVLFVPGAAFFSDQHDGTWLRLSFASQDENGLKDGIDRLTEAIETCSSLPRL